MRVLIFEPGGGTHFFQHVALIAGALDELGCDTIVSLAQDGESLPGHGAFIAPLAASAPRTTVRYESPPLLSVPIARSPSYRLRWLNEAIARHRPDHVLVTYGDGLMHEVGLRRITGRSSIAAGVDAEVLLFKGRVAYPGGKDRLRQRVVDRGKWFFADAGRWSQKFHIDPFVCEMQRRQGVPEHRRFHVMPEPLEPASKLSKTDARAKLSLEPNGRWIVLPGGIDGRKGADRLLRAFAHARLSGESRLLLLGKVDPAMRGLIDVQHASDLASGRIVVRDGFVEDEVLLAAIRAADVVAAPHRSCYQSSGIVLRAAIAGRPLVGTALGWIGRTIDAFGLGRTCDVDAPDAFAQALAATLDDCGRFDETGPGARALTAFHTIPNFQRAWTRQVRAKLGLPTTDDRVDGAAFNQIIERAV